jgi:hypothetical protein
MVFQLAKWLIGVSASIPGFSCDDSRSCFTTPVWNIRVQYIQESRNREFGILSNAPWDDFYSTACSHLAVDPQKAQLAFYMSGEGYYSGLVSLKGEQEWENAMLTFIRAARQDRGMEFEILDVNGAVRPFANADLADS